MQKPLRKDYPSHQAWVAEMEKWKAAYPKRQDFKTHSEWITAVDAFKKASKPVKEVKVENNDKTEKVKVVKPEIKSVGKTDFNVSTKAGKEAYELALKNSKVKKGNNAENKNNNTLKINSKYKQVTQEELDKKIAEIKDKEKKLKIGYRRTKGEGIEGKGDGYRGDTRITKKLKKAGFTETRLARLRKEHAEWKKKRKKKV